MQGTQNNNVASGAVDLDALLATRELKPTSVLFKGKAWHVRTDLTGTELVRVLAFDRADDIYGQLTIIGGTPGEVKALNDALDERKRAEDAVAEAQRSGDTEARVTYAPLPYGKNARALGDLLLALPRLHSALALANIWRATQVLAEFALTDEAADRKFGYVGESGAS